MIMNKLLLLIGFVLPLCLGAQSNLQRENEAVINAYLQSIQENRAKLTAFFSAMPKGGDLHHHFSGSVYGETFLEILEGEDFWVNRNTLQVTPTLPPNKDQAWARVSTLKALGLYESMKNDLLMFWSVKDYYTDPEDPSHEHFFESFPKFSAVSELALDRGLTELKNRAVTENVQYIETMLRTIPYDWAPFDTLEAFTEQLLAIQSRQDERALDTLLDRLFAHIQHIGIDSLVDAHNKRIHDVHDSLQLDSDQFIMRYQNFVLRFKKPVRLFTDLVLCFASADKSPLITGVNIVAPEHGTVSMRDYWLHMHFFRYCSQQFPQVKKAMHAGELVLGLVPPEELSWHINAAVKVAGANRIGHGVDIGYELAAYDLMQYMKENEIAVEINLWSNAFILEVEGDEHPVQLYHESGVPIVISTDDAGVLRSNLTDQYVLLAHEQRFLDYSQIKQIVYNSIRYSFIEEPTVRKKLLTLLDQSFKAFEATIITYVKDR